MNENKWAVIEEAVEMFRSGFDEKDVAIKLHEKIISAFGIKIDAQAKIAASKTEAERKKNIAACWRQKTQEWKSITALPQESLIAYRRRCLGEEGEKLNGEQIKRLYGANSGGTKFAPTEEYCNLYQQFVSNNLNK